MRSVYILLTRTNTVFSKLIHAATLAEYTHSSLCVSDSMDEFFSFGRKLPLLPFPSGFVKEQLDSGYFGAHQYTPCILLELYVEEKVYEKLCEKIREMWKSAACYRYDVLGILFLALHIEHKRPNHYFCSQFVGELLSESGALKLPKDASLMCPIDYKNLPQFHSYSDLYPDILLCRHSDASFCIGPGPVPELGGRSGNLEQICLYRHDDPAGICSHYSRRTAGNRRWLRFRHAGRDSALPGRRRYRKSADIFVRA